MPSRSPTDSSPFAPSGAPFPDVGTLAAVAPLAGAAPRTPSRTWAAAAAAGRADATAASTDRPGRRPATTRPDGRLPSAVKAVGAVLLVVAVFVGGIAVGKSDAPGRARRTAQSRSRPRCRRSSRPMSRPGRSSTTTTSTRRHSTRRSSTYGSVNGLVEAVGDTGHTRFLTPDEVKDQHTSLSGSIVGIGALMNTDQRRSRSSSRSSRADRPTGPASGPAIGS